MRRLFPAVTCQLRHRSLPPVCYIAQSIWRLAHGMNWRYTQLYHSPPKSTDVYTSRDLAESRAPVIDCRIPDRRGSCAWSIGR
jgi:hypothetical protein